MDAFDSPLLNSLVAQLDRHAVYRRVRDLPTLRQFMQQHVYAVWDFMSLVKSLQHRLAPITVPWLPAGDPEVRRFINELVLAEESDATPPGFPGPAHLSHFELYCMAMAEVGADHESAETFVTQVRQQGLRAALAAARMPDAARAFVGHTFDVIDSEKPHVVAAALAFGREHIIPEMFRALLRDMRIKPADAPAFQYYLERHIHLDEGEHGPMTEHMLQQLCGDDPVKIREAQEAAVAALRARLTFWDGVAATLDDPGEWQQAS
jgi:hypothetical protein